MNKGRLLRRGYFPKELPPNFSTTKFGTAASRANAPPFPAVHQVHTEPVRHSIARLGVTRREVALPNPVSFFHLASTFEIHWSTLKNAFESTRLSLSTPRLRNAGLRAIAPRTTLDSLPLERAKLRASGRVVLHADIAEFYRSIYTHSIAWCTETKAWAKDPRNRRDYSRCGNAIDRAIQNSQDGQTNGVPVGPDTSFVIGEVILASVDAELRRRLGVWPRGFRHYDDYELVFDSIGEAEAAQSALAAAAAEVELQLNSRKTTISELPQGLTNRWTRKLRAPLGFFNREPAIFELFETAFELKQQRPDDFVLAYVISRMEREALNPREWALLEQLLAQCANVEPSCLPHVVRVWSARKVRGGELNVALIRETLRRAIVSHVPLAHGSEVAWAVWASIALGVSIDRTATAALGESDDDVVALLALDAQQRGLAPGLDVSRWGARMTTPSLSQEHWLLAYEASVKAWLPSAAGGDHIAANASFAWMRASGVSFYTRFRQLTARVVRRLAPSRHHGYGGDDDDDDDDEDEEEEETY